MNSIPRPPVHRIALFQLAIVLPLALALAAINTVTALSVLTGALIQIGPQAWFSRQAYKYTGARQVRMIVQEMYKAEAGKMVLIAALFITVFVVAPQLNFLLVFCSFTVMIPVHCWLAVSVLRQ